MTKHTERTIIILAFAAFGVFDLSIRTAFIPDSIEHQFENPLILPQVAQKEQEGMLIVERPKADGIIFNYVWDLSDSPKNTLLFGEYQIFSELKNDEPHWKITLKKEKNDIVWESDAPTLNHCSAWNLLETNYYIIPMNSGEIMMPDGCMHRQHFVELHCELTLTPPFWGKPMKAVASQRLMLDYDSGTADLVEPRPLMTVYSYEEGFSQRLVVQGAPSNLPARIEGSALRQELLRAFYGLAAVNDHASATRVAGFLREKSLELIDCYALADAAWPECWDYESETAIFINQEIRRTLVRLEENECYQSQPLINFINSDAFGRIFGERFVDTPPSIPEELEPVVTEPVVTEPVVTEPVVTEPVVTEPVVTEPVVTEPVVTEPVVTEPVVTEPVVTEPVVTEPVVTEPVVTEPVVTEPVVTEPVVTEPVVTEPQPAQQPADVISPDIFGSDLFQTDSAKIDKLLEVREKQTPPSPVPLIPASAEPKLEQVVEPVKSDVPKQEEELAPKEELPADIFESELFS